MVDNIIDKITKQAAFIKESDLDEWIVPELFDFFSIKINWLAKHSYQNTSELAVKAFRERAKIELRKGTFTFLFTTQLWKNGRDLGPYLKTCLNWLSKRILFENNAAKRTQLLVCPFCKITTGRKEFLFAEDNLWRCACCSEMYEILLAQLDVFKIQNDPKEVSNLECKIRLHNIFSLHSKKGYRCLDCSRFIPESINTSYGITCPYDNCFYMGNVSELQMMAHPVTSVNSHLISLNDLNEGKGQKKEHQKYLPLQDRLESNFISADVCIEVEEQCEIEYTTLVNVIEEQIESIKRINSSGTMVQKILMYEAFKIMLCKFPEEMMSYLVHRNDNQEFPIQNKIFQVYAELLENYLPFSIKKKNETIDILDLTDPNLSLFLGISTFETEVKSNQTIPNKTAEMYTGGRKFKCYGPCFIGKIIDITDLKTNKSIKNNIQEYNFVQIKMDETILPGTLVKVDHYRISSHYEMKSLVHLQRIRRNLVDKVYFILNKKHRKPGE